MNLQKGAVDGATPLRDLSALSIDRSAGSQHSKQLSRAHRRLILLSVLMCLAGAIWLWRQSAPLAVETAVVSTVYPAQALTLLNATGYVVAQRRASVASKATGRLEWLSVTEGTKVRKGEVIARLENRDTQAMRDLAAANVLVAKANLGMARADLVEAELAFTRTDVLSDKKLVSAADHDSATALRGKALAAVAGYEAAVAVAEANLRVSDVALDQTFIRAPFDGVVLTLNAGVGDTITPFSQAVDTRGAVVTIADMDTLEVEADVAEASYLAIHEGQPVEIQLDAIPGQRFEGVVSRMVPTVDRAKASTLVKIRFRQHDPRILPEMSARAAFLDRGLTEAEHKPILAVPASALFEAEGKLQVFVVENGKARMRPVKRGAKIGDQIEVHGLDQGTRVVIRPPQGLTDGHAVNEEAT